MNFVHSKAVQTLIHNYKLPIHPKGGQSRTFNQATVYDALSLKYRKAIIVARSIDYGYFNIESGLNQWGSIYGITGDAKNFRRPSYSLLTVFL